jgi:hypothetical protein
MRPWVQCRRIPLADGGGWRLSLRSPWELPVERLRHDIAQLATDLEKAHAPAWVLERLRAML